MPELNRPTNLDEQFSNENIPIGLPWRFLLFSIVLFAFSIFVYFGLRYGYEAYLNNQEKDLSTKIDNLVKQVSQADQQNFVNFYSQLANLKKALDRHQFVSNVFVFLEKNTIGQVSYDSADFAADGLTITMKGKTTTSDTLVQQLNIFDNAPELSGIVLNQMATNQKGGVVFNVSLTFQPSFFGDQKITL